MTKSPEGEHPVKAFGWAATDTSGHLSPFNFSRRETGDEDVRFKVLYCGICHSDLHSIKNEWGFSTYPMVPGRDPDQMQAAVGTMDGIIDTVSAVHPILPLISLLKSQGKLVMVGVPEKPLELPVFSLIMGRKTVAGSGIGGMKETQEMIDFAAKHNIKADIEVISMDYVNTAMERLAKADAANAVFDVRDHLQIKERIRWKAPGEGLYKLNTEAALDGVLQRVGPPAS
ncbi:hypothetical protein LWI28_026398 [Acer negundo]|uniref:Alcohol dehydrogenase-like C-terminal domain-containing protein n=1 Tax=Acer negundo TaxID=4023 RepID=A0AAD5NLJ1_ACENE|nr:hypothetical protein LWI28_026398 [Acer negundo]